MQKYWRQTVNRGLPICLHREEAQHHHCQPQLPSQGGQDKTMDRVWPEQVLSNSTCFLMTGFRESHFFKDSDSESEEKIKAIVIDISNGKFFSEEKRRQH